MNNKRMNENQLIIVSLDLNHALNACKDPLRSSHIRMRSRSSIAFASEQDPPYDVQSRE